MASRFALKYTNSIETIKAEKPTIAAEVDSPSPAGAPVSGRRERRPEDERDRKRVNQKVAFAGKRSGFKADHHHDRQLGVHCIDDLGLGARPHLLPSHDRSCARSILCRHRSGWFLIHAAPIPTLVTTPCSVAKTQILPALEQRYDAGIASARQAQPFQAYLPGAIIASVPFM